MTESIGNTNKQTTNAIPAFLTSVIDICLIFMVYFVIYLGLAKIPRVTSLYESHQQEAVRIQDVYKVEYDLGYKLYSIDENYETYTNYPIYTDDNGEYKVITKAYNKDQETYDEYKAKVDKYNEALNKDTTYGHERIIISLLQYEIRLFAFAISAFVFLFLIPFISKKRYTVGRYSAKCDLISVKSTFTASRWQVFGRFSLIFVVTALLGIYLNPVLILLVYLAATAMMLFIGKQGRTIRDYITGTKMVVQKETQQKNTEEI